ncbi:MAG TPA: protein kinase, partial [Ktedonobacteraceae bacterium]|nr:protein kinase [Ktedonobacteraceae bacterium]
HTLPDSHVEAFQREASVLASLSHPYILPIFGFGLLYRQEEQLDITTQLDQDEERGEAKQARCLPYLVLAYAERGSLADVFSREGNRPWSLNRVVTIAREIADALDYAHSQGVLHRDVKPANILHMGTHVLLSDFSVSTLIDAEVSHLSTPWAGSPAYMAPEVWQLHPGRYSDQYALAITCFHLLTGDLPLHKDESMRARSWSHVHNFVQPRSLLELRPELPMAVDFVLQRAMSKNPHDRYPTVTAFATDLLIASQDNTQDLVPMVDTREIGKGARGRVSHAGNNRNTGQEEKLPEKPQPQVEKPFVAASVQRSIPALMSVPSLREPNIALVDAPQTLPHAEPHYQPLQPAQPIRPVQPVQSIQARKPRPTPVKPAPLMEVSTESLAPGRKRDRWTWSAFSLNLFISIGLLAFALVQMQTLQEILTLALALWPALIVGPLLATFFRDIRYRSLSWGLFWGSFFGLANGLFSSLLCLAWFALALFASGLSCSSGCNASGGTNTLLSAIPFVESHALIPVVLGQWVSIFGGALIGIFHIRYDAKQA